MFFHSEEFDMKVPATILFFAMLFVFQQYNVAAQWSAPVAPVISEADGYVSIPNAAVMPQKSSIYKAVFNATSAADKPTQLVPALNMAGSELNLLGALDLPLRNAKFVVVFHG